MCRKDDCGLCLFCEKKAGADDFICLRNVCENIPVKDKVQWMGISFPCDWGFAIQPTPCEDGCKEQLCMCSKGEEIGGFLTLTGPLTTTCCLRAACKEFTRNKQAMDNAMADFASMLGVDLKVEVEDVLVGKSFFRRWVDVSAQPRSVYGTFSKCFRYIDGHKSYRAEYRKNSYFVQNNRCVDTGLSLPSFQDCVSQEGKLHLDLPAGC